MADAGVESTTCRLIETRLAEKIPTGVLLAIVVQGTLASPVCLEAEVLIETATLST